MKRHSRTASRISFLLSCTAAAGCVMFTGLFLWSCSYDVRVVNGSKEPVPTAPMATQVPLENGTVSVNPQMGPPPSGPFDQRPPEPSFPWLPVLLGVAGIAIPGLGAAGALVAKVKAIKAALGVVVDAVEAAPKSAGDAVKSTAAAAGNTTLNEFVAKRTD